MSQNGADLKRKRPEPPSAYSQPADTGTGRHWKTQVTYAVDYLKDKNRPVAFSDIYKYLNIGDSDQNSKKTIRYILRNHPKVEYHASAFEGKGGYQYRPPHGVRSSQDLLILLQNQSTAQGVFVRELKDGWSEAVEEIERLVAKQQVLVTRNKKDGTPKMVWPNDPTLSNRIDDDFKKLWTEVKVPQAAKDLRAQLMEWGLTPTSQVKENFTKTPLQKRKQRGPRASGKTTNAHMGKGTLRDFSHMRPGNKP